MGKKGVNRVNSLGDQTMGLRANLKYIVALLILCLVPNLVIAQGKKAQPSQPKPVALKVAVVGTVEEKEDKALPGVDYAPPGKIAGGLITTVGKCGWVNLSEGRVSRVYLAIGEVKSENGQVLPEWSGKSLRIACEKLDEVGRFRGKEVQIQGFIREGKRIAGKEIDIVIVSELNPTVTIMGTLERSFMLYQGMYTIKLKEYPDVEIKAPEGKLNILAWIFAVDQGKKVHITYQVKRDNPDSKPINILVSGEILE